MQTQRPAMTKHITPRPTAAQYNMSQPVVACSAHTAQSNPVHSTPLALTGSEIISVCLHSDSFLNPPSCTAHDTLTFLFWLNGIIITSSENCTHHHSQYFDCSSSSVRPHEWRRRTPGALPWWSHRKIRHFLALVISCYNIKHKPRRRLSYTKRLYLYFYVDTQNDEEREGAIIYFVTNYRM
jgi:hypothetical protein